MKRLILIFPLLMLSLSLVSGAHAARATFDDFIATIPYTGPGGGAYQNGQDLLPLAFADDPFTPGPDNAVNKNAFGSGGAVFANNYNTNFGSWSGWSYSNTKDTNTAGFTNQFSAITGNAFSGSQYGVYFDPADETPTVFFGGPVNPVDAYITNTTYAYKAVVEGDDGSTPPFVKGPFGQGDFFTLTVYAFDRNGAQVGSKDIFLADYTSSDPNDWFALDAWTRVDLSELGTVFGLGFDLSSSDVGDFGMNTPAYFAMDDLQYEAVPLPGALWLLGPGLLGLLALRRRRRP
jgi:hypothetical protein